MKYKEKVIEFLKSTELTEKQKSKLEEVFPELKESEDERIKDEILSYFRLVEPTYIPDSQKRQRWSDWIEKQGEKKPVVIIPKFSVGDIIRHKEQGFTCKIIAVDTEYRLFRCNGNYLPFECQDDYELVEQKSDASETMNEKRDFDNGFTRMMENKQKPAEWTIDDNVILNDIICAVNASDALSGTIPLSLAKHEKKISWLKSLKDRVQPQTQQEWSEWDKKMLQDAISLAHEVEDRDLFHWLESLKDRVQPQTQQEWSKLDNRIEDCIGMCLTDISEKRFDDFKTSLKECLDWLHSLKDRICYQHAQEWSEDDRIHYNISPRKEDTYDYKRVDLDKFDERIREFSDMLEDKPKPYWDGWYEAMDWIRVNGTPFEDEKQGEQKSAEWAIEDEQMLEAVLYDGENVLGERHKEWLKSLKDRIWYQHAQEWSEDDEMMLGYAIEHFEIQKRNSIEGGSRKKAMQEFIDWLKSLRPQNRWKPSDVQIETLKDAIDALSAEDTPLASLYEDLKNL